MGVRDIRAEGSTTKLTIAGSMVADLVGPLTALIRSIDRPQASAVGHWSVADTAAHLGHVATLDTWAVSEGAAIELDPAIFGDMPQAEGIDDVAVLTNTLLERDPVRDQEIVADAIARAVARLLEVVRSADSDRRVTWLFGAQLPLSTVCAHLIYEMTLHGYDIARGSTRPWTIDPRHAIAAIEWGLIPILGAVTPEPAPDARTEVVCAMRLRNGPRFAFVERGDVVVIEPVPKRADLTISSDPVAALLVMSGRTGPLPHALRGKVFAWGRHPLRAVRMLNGMSRP